MAFLFDFGRAGPPKTVLFGAFFHRFCKFSMKKSVLKLRHENEAFLALIWRGRRQWGGLPESSDSAEHGESVQSRPAPPAGVRRILRATPSAAGPFWLLGIAIWGPWCLLFDILGAILAPRDHPGGPWEQQDGREVANNRILVDFGVTGPVLCQFEGLKMLKNPFYF